ncbi:MAG: hypothetical protein L0H41_01100 [Microlunatus sp.]|nr:hypothetical protein [Microlunatus sp.]MDN5769316.1 hypothetical protein [Microlunatus sp.]
MPWSPLARIAAALVLVGLGFAFAGFLVGSGLDDELDGLAVLPPGEEVVSVAVVVGLGALVAGT